MKRLVDEIGSAPLGSPPTRGARIETMVNGHPQMDGMVAPYAGGAD